MGQGTSVYHRLLFHKPHLNNLSGAFNALSKKTTGLMNLTSVFVNIMYDQAFSEKPDDQRKALKELIDEILG